MTVQELIKKLEAINAKDIQVMFKCPTCEKFIPVEDMKCFGFSVDKSFPEK